jgi:hypothetical protein
MLNPLGFYLPVAVMPPAASYVSMDRGTKGFRVFPQFDGLASFTNLGFPEQSSLSHARRFS